MTDDDFTQLQQRIHAGQRPTDDLRALSRSELDRPTSIVAAENFSDALNLALHNDLVMPLDAARALVKTALAGGTSYPITTNDGLIYDRLSPIERTELANFILHRLQNIDATTVKQVLLDFADDLDGPGPLV